MERLKKATSIVLGARKPQRTLSHPSAFLLSEALLYKLFEQHPNHDY
tara:strand:- start:5384 stop:5524 length:141 start_codon:yes stop_codon:yes gene_type:complete